MQEFNKRVHEAKMAHYRAEEEVEFAEELLEAARTEDLAQTVERAALIRRTQKEVRFAKSHLAEEKESTKVLDPTRQEVEEEVGISATRHRNGG